MHIHCILCLYVFIISCLRFETRADAYQFTVLQEGRVVTHAVRRHKHPFAADGGIDLSSMVLIKTPEEVVYAKNLGCC